MVSDITLPEATMEDILDEIGRRARAVVVTMLVTPRTHRRGSEGIKIYFRGDTVACIGLTNATTVRLMSQVRPCDPEEL